MHILKGSNQNNKNQNKKEKICKDHFKKIILQEPKQKK